MPPTLIGLPRELRDAVYQHMTNTYANIYHTNPLNLKTSPSGTRKYTQGTHSLMKTNRKLRAEVQEHLRHYETYFVSQRYRAYAGLENMIIWKPAPVPTSAKRLYLRIYVAVPAEISEKIAVDSMFASVDIQIASLGEVGVQDDHSRDFAVLEAVLQDCCYLEDLVLEMVVRRQESVFGQGCESSDCDLDTQTVADLGIAAMEREIQKLPCLQRYVASEGSNTKFVRRNIGQQWTRQCLVPQCVPMCHCYGAYGTTCVEESRELLASLIPCAADEWLGVRSYGKFRAR